ncbi:MAG: hypothetical protein DRG24_09660 [Epsilonproteobacteria bacterium]|nr:MAG: hypothetical protein DRG24_09660 [Campylobacterota bacterium]
MQQFIKWTLESIRSEGAMLNWLEELRFDWTSTTAQAIKQILEGKTVILITDHKRKWFENYIVTSINQLTQERPMIPLVSLDAIYPNFDSLTGGDSIAMIEDLLELSYKGEFVFWYIGKGDDKRADIAKRCNDSYLWIMDENFHNALALRSYDPLIDIKLLQLYRQFDLTLSAMLFGEVSVNE